jgi:hypothetical protein
MAKFLSASFVRQCLGLIGLIAGAVQVSVAMPLVAADLADRKGGEIIWDEYGIPDIYGSDLVTVLKGYGCAQMENHAELILQKVAEARGRTAQYFGAGVQNANAATYHSLPTEAGPCRFDVIPSCCPGFEGKTPARIPSSLGFENS